VQRANLPSPTSRGQSSLWRSPSPALPMMRSGDGSKRGLTSSAAAVAAAVSALVARPEVASAVEQAAQVASQDTMMAEIGVYLAKTVIAWGVPAAVVGLLLLKIISSSRPPQDALDEGPMKRFSLFGMPMKPGEPQDLFKIERLNERLENFQYSFEKADSGRRSALISKKRKEFERNYGIQIGSLTDKQIESIIMAEKRYREIDERLLDEVDKNSQELRSLAVSLGAAAPGAATGNETQGGIMKMMDSMTNRRKLKAVEKKLTKLTSARLSNELSYISAVGSQLDKNQKEKLESLLKSRRGPGFSDKDSFLSFVPAKDGQASHDARHVYVLSFPGDVTASQVAGLRQEVTAISRYANVSRGDEVVLILNSGGGTVTGYGLAAAQLMRIKQLGLKLTICVEQVAASGGYMMACCADRLTASPFAVLGSIGVISEQPNVYERLNREGVEFLTVTAGKFKRTLTPFKKPTTEDFEKSKQDIEQVFLLFKDWVRDQRPSLDIDAVATGETWFGRDALQRKLVDELVTSDDVLLEKIDQGCEIFSVKYQEPSGPLASLLPQSSYSFKELAAAALLKWLGIESAAELRPRPENKYLMLEDRASSTQLRGD